MYNNILPVNSLIVEYVKAGNMRMDITNRPHCFSMKVINDVNNNSLDENSYMTIVDGMSMKARSILDNDVISWNTKCDVSDLREYDLLLFRMPNDAEKNSGKLKTRLFKEVKNNKVYTYKFDDNSSLIESSSYHSISSIIGKEKKIYKGEKALSFINEDTQDIEFTEVICKNDSCQTKLKKVDVVSDIINNIIKNDSNKKEIIDYIFSMFIGYGDNKDEAINNLKDHLNSGLNVFRHLNKTNKKIDHLSKAYFEFLTCISGYGCVK